MATIAPSKNVKINQRAISVPTGLFINNEFVKARSGKTFEVEDPATAKVLLSIEEGQPEDVDIAVKAAREAFEGGWAESDPAWRGSLLLRLADLVEKYQEDILTIEIADSGKTLKQAQTIDLPGVLGTLRYYAGWADKVYGRTAASAPGTFSYTLREPIGVCGQIIPWK